MSTLLQETEPQYINLRQFEKNYRPQLISWFLERRKCRRKEAERFSTLVMLNLKASFPVKKDLRLSSIWQLIHKFTTDELFELTKSMEKNFGLTESAFNQLLAKLKQGDHGLFEQVFLSHFQDCMNYLKRNYSATAADAYDISMETMMEFLVRMKADKIKYGNLRFLFTQMAGQLYLKWIRKESRKKEKEVEVWNDLPEQVDEDHLQILQKAWLGLCDNCQALLKNFYYEGIALKELAGTLNKTPQAIRKQKQRCVEKLRHLFSQIS